MESILDDKKFLEDYEKLKQVPLNPEKHSTTNAFEHTEMVVKRAQELAKENSCSPEETQVLKNLAYLHDIGKISNNANPSESVKRLSQYKVTDENLINLVKYHDINLSWYLSALRQEKPSQKSWNKMAQKTNVRLLCLFMIADRIDCPGGWKMNKALMWFLEEMSKQNLVSNELRVDGERIF